MGQERFQQPPEEKADEEKILNLRKTDLNGKLPEKVKDSELKKLVEYQRRSSHDEVGKNSRLDGWERSR